MTNTAQYFPVPASWTLEARHVIFPLRLTRNETAALVERIKEFWGLPGEFSVSVLNQPLGDFHVHVEFEGESRFCSQITDVVYTFYNDVNNDVIEND
jgi:hypothetical protein